MHASPCARVPRDLTCELTDEIAQESRVHVLAALRRLRDKQAGHATSPPMRMPLVWRIMRARSHAAMSSLGV